MEPTDLEYLGFALIVNAEHAFDCGGDIQQGWQDAAQRYIDQYHAMLAHVSCREDGCDCDHPICTVCLKDYPCELAND
jgi:hypothetical protein